MEVILLRSANLEENKVRVSELTLNCWHGQDWKLLIIIYFKKQDHGITISLWLVTFIYYRHHSMWLIRERPTWKRTEADAPQPWWVLRWQSSPIYQPCEWTIMKADLLAPNKSSRSCFLEQGAATSATHWQSFRFMSKIIYFYYFKLLCFVVAFYVANHLCKI